MCIYICVKCKLDKMSCRGENIACGCQEQGRYPGGYPSPITWLRLKLKLQEIWGCGMETLKWIISRPGLGPRPFFYPAPLTIKCYLLRFANINPWVFASKIYGARDTRESFGGGIRGIVVFMTATWPAHINGQLPAPKSRVLRPPESWSEIWKCCRKAGRLFVRSMYGYVRVLLGNWICRRLK